MLDMNETGCRLFGYAWQEIRSLSIFRLICEDHHPLITKAVEEVRAGIAQSSRHELKMMTRSGESVWVELMKVPLLRKGKPVAIQAAGWDITERRICQDQLVRHQKRIAMGRMAEAIVHDFNNLFTTMMINTNMMLKSVDPDKEKEEYRRIKCIRETIDRAAHLTRQLSFSGGKQSSARRVLNINEVVLNLESIVSGMFGPEIKYHHDLQPDLKAIQADPDQMEHLLLNLLLNAREAMPDGGEVAVTTRNQWLRPGSVIFQQDLQSGHYVVVSVTDTGTGIEPEIGERIFDPYYSTKRNGRGMGLTVADGIARMTGGGITVQSKWGEGSTFSVYFPASEAKAIESAGSSLAKTAAGGGNETILVVDDEVAILNLLAEILGELGYRVLITGSYEEAILMAGKMNETLDLLIADFNLPGKNGPEISQELMILFPQIKTLYMSGDPNRPSNTRDDGGQFITKPFTPHALVTKVHEILTGAKPPGEGPGLDLPFNKAL